jgi:aryl-phospho-beta-D-glucosidase BglC (GH1 family)
MLDFQNWTIELWKQIASRYRDHPWVAGYNPLNEPTDKTHVKLLNFYDRVVKAIRSVDPDHLSKLQGLTLDLTRSFP